MERIFMAMESKDEESQEFALQCLASLGQQEYEHM